MDKGKEEETMLWGHSICDMQGLEGLFFAAEDQTQDLVHAKQVFFL